MIQASVEDSLLHWLAEMTPSVQDIESLVYLLDPMPNKKLLHHIYRNINHWISLIEIYSQMLYSQYVYPARVKMSNMHVYIAWEMYGTN